MFVLLILQALGLSFFSAMMVITRRRDPQVYNLYRIALLCGFIGIVGTALAMAVRS